MILRMRPVAAMAEITYRKFAQGTLTATAQISRTGEDLMAAIEVDIKVAFEVIVDIRDDTVVEMKVNRYVSPLRA